VTAAERLAPVLCDRFFEVVEWSTRWSSADAQRRQTFSVMAEFALAAGRRGERTIEGLAKALAAGFARDCQLAGVRPLPWPILTDDQREVFRLLATRAVEWAAEQRASGRNAA